MRKSISTLLMAASLIACATGIHAQTVDELVKKHVDAIGGIDNWRKVNSVILKGSMPAEGAEIPVTITTLNNKGYRAEYIINGMVNYTILTPVQGWEYMPAQGVMKPEAMPAEAVKEQQDGLDAQMDGLIDYKAKGNTVTYLGKDDVEGTDCYKLKVVYKGGKEETVYLDASSYFCIHAVEKTKANGQEQESTSNLSNYQKLPEGIFFPMVIDIDGQAINIKEVKINSPVAESVFKPAETK